jgi:hypothetical protein
MTQTSAAGAKGWVAAALAGVVAGLVAAHAFGSSAPPGPATTLQIVDRSHKGDRLDRGLSPASDAYTSDAHASGRMALRHLFERTRSLELHEACEPPASPIVDPLLAKLPGRCLT